MNWSLVFTITRRIARQIRRDRRTIGLMVVAPLVVTFIFAAMFSGSVTGVPTAICVQDEPWESTLGNAIYQHLERNENTSVIARQRSNAFDGFGNSLQAVLILPSSLTEDLLKGENVTSELYINVTTLVQAQFIQGTIGNASKDALAEVTEGSGFAFNSNVVIQLPTPPIGIDLSFNISIVNEDIGFTTVIGESIEDFLSKDGNVTLVTCESRGDVIESIYSENAIAGLYVPPNLTRVILAGDEPSFEVFVNGIETTEMSIALAAIENSVSDAIQSAVGRGTNITVTYVFGSASMSMMDLAGPSVIGFFALFFGFIISGVFFLRERQQGTLERMLASPLTEVEIVIGYVIAFMVVSAVQSIMIAGIIIYFSPDILPKIGLLIPLVFLIVFGSVTLAIGLTYRMKTELQVIQMIPLFIVPQMFLSGMFFSLSFLPPVLQLLPYFFPLTYYVMAVKAVVFFDASIIDILPFIGALILYSLLGLAVAIVRRRG